MDTSNINIIEKTVISQIQVHGFKYVWTIKNFDRFVVQNDHKNYIESPKFTTGDNNDYSWTLNLFLNGSDGQFDNYWSIRLNSDDDISDLIPGCVIFSFVNRKGERSMTEKQQLKSVSKFDHFINKDILACEIGGWLQTGELTIICEVYYNQTIDHDIVPIKQNIDEVPVDHRLKAVDDFERLLDTEKFSDVKLVVGDKEYHAYKGILAVRSRVFSAMFEHNMKENQENVVEITDVDPHVMKEVLRYVYTGKVNNIKELAALLLDASDKYEIVSLKAVCEDVLIDQLTPENIGKVLLLVDRHKADKLREATMKFLATHGKDCSAMENFDDIMKPLSSSLLIAVTKALMSKN